MLPTQNKFEQKKINPTFLQLQECWRLIYAVVHAPTTKEAIELNAAAQRLVRYGHSYNAQQPKHLRDLLAEAEHELAEEDKQAYKEHLKTQIINRRERSFFKRLFPWRIKIERVT